MSLTSRNILINLLYYGVTLVALPWTILSAEAALGYSRSPGAALRVASVLLALAGAGLQLWCITLFQTRGEGTPSPAYAPKKLVTTGHYARVRNPMNVGELMLLLALAGWFASPALLAYAVAAALMFHLFVTFWEEPQHLRKFGEEYAAYRSNVGRWVPKRQGVRDSDSRLVAGRS